MTVSHWQRVLNGETAYASSQDDAGFHTFHLICNLLHNWVVNRGLPELLASPVEWRERSNNKMVDYLANKSMDERGSLKW